MHPRLSGQQAQAEPFHQGSQPYMQETLKGARPRVKALQGRGRNSQALKAGTPSDSAPVLLPPSPPQLSANPALHPGAGSLLALPPLAFRGSRLQPPLLPLRLRLKKENLPGPLLLSRPTLPWAPAHHPTLPFHQPVPRTPHNTPEALGAAAWPPP